MCNSTDFVKQDSAFVCQSCGLKYSIEEAKKMMSDGLAKSTGKTVATNTAKLDNLYKLARRAKDENNTEKAAQYYDQILLEDTNSWEAMFYSNFYAAIQKWRNGEKGSALSSLQNCIGNVIGIIKGTDEEYSAVTEIVKQLNGICLAFYEGNKGNFNAFYSRYLEIDYSLRNHNSFLRYISQISGINKGIAQIYYVLGVGMLEIANAKNYLDDVIETAMENAIRMVNNNPCDYIFRAYSGLPDIPHLENSVHSEATKLENLCYKVRKLLEEKREALAKQRLKEYWDAHQTEKAALESEKQSLTQQIADLDNKEIPAIPGYAEVKKLNEKVDALTYKKETIGFFKFKEKKAVQQQIDSTKTEINDIMSRVNPIIEEIRKRISEYKDRIETIDTELTKPR